MKWLLTYASALFLFAKRFPWIHSGIMHDSTVNCVLCLDVCLIAYCSGTSQLALHWLVLSGGE